MELLKALIIYLIKEESSSSDRNVVIRHPLPPLILNFVF